MAVRDGEDFVAEAVESVLIQTLTDFELLVVDDGSSDRTPKIVAELARRDERVRVLSQRANGASRARNLACSEARSPYLACLDADDVASAERLELQAVFLDEHEEVAVVGGAGVFIDDRGHEIGHATYPSEPIAADALLEAGRSPLIHSAATMRAAAFRSTSGYRPAMVVAYDFDLWLRLRAYGGIANLTETVVRYRLHGGQASSRSIGQTAAETCAALASSRRRDLGEPDPLDEADSVDNCLLELLDVRPEEIAMQEVDYALWLAGTLSRGARHDETERLWALCATRAGATTRPRSTKARVLRARADVSAWQGRRVRAAALRAAARALDAREPG